MKFFATAGPVRQEINYYVPLSERLNETEMYTLIEQQAYFILHAPRQTGKTSVILNLANELNRNGIYNALYVNVEMTQVFRNDFLKAQPSLLQAFLEGIESQLPQEEHIISYLRAFVRDHEARATGTMLYTMLRYWALHSKKPIVLFIDEIDSLIGDTLISVLRQLRAGYKGRPHEFPHSVCLVGVRDVRDYRIWSPSEGQTILGGSAFNIKAKSLHLENFTKSQVYELYTQHTVETEQKFDDEAVEYAFELTQGQPWLVNALAYEACFAMVTDRTQPITKQIIEKAKETLIFRRDTHLDVLIGRLREPRVKTIMNAIITSTHIPLNVPSDDIRYAIDLGLIARRDKNLVIANPIYQEISSL